MKLSVVIPAYNEENRIGATLDSLGAYLTEQKYSSEILVVDDGSQDKTQQVVLEKMDHVPGLRLLENGQNRGKGYTVRHGITEAKGDFVLFFDADASTPIDQVEYFLPKFEQGYDVCIGSRAVTGSDIVVHQPWIRENMGRVFNLFVRLLTMGDFKDTQCGFKAFSAKAANVVFQRQTIWGFGFDVEVLYIAKKFGFRIAEVPIKWINSPDSKVSPTMDALKMFWDLLDIRIKDMKGVYR